MACYKISEGLCLLVNKCVMWVPFQILLGRSDVAGWGAFIKVNAIVET